MTTCLTCAPRATPTPSRGIILLTRAPADHIHATEGRGSGSGGTGKARGHLLCHLWGTLLCTVFTKKCQKRSKKGVPPVFDHFWEDFGYQGTPHPRMAPRRAKLASLCHPSRPIRALWEGFFEVGGTRCPKSSKSTIFRRGRAHT